MAPSCWDLRLVSELKSWTNLECLPFSVVPTVPFKHLPRPMVETTNDLCPQVDKEEEMVDSFCLGDFWKSYEGWSAYGVGVPIILPDGENLMQYYFPSLSAMQIFTYKKMRTREDSTESESETTSDEDHSFDEHEGSEEIEEDPGELYCQYNEILHPYARVPLTEKVKELAHKYPGLTSYRSTDLTPRSWVSIAWYPIIHIPVTRNMRELSGAFLTYHILSWSLQGLANVIPEDTNRTECIVPWRREVPKALDDGGDKREIAIPPFAMSTYKMHGTFWVNPKTPDEDFIISYRRAAWLWLKYRKFHHHDYDFFVSRGI